MLVDAAWAGPFPPPPTYPALPVPGKLAANRFYSPAGGLKYRAAGAMRCASASRIGGQALEAALEDGTFTQTPPTFESLFAFNHENRL